MNYLSPRALDDIDAEDFRTRKPYPWVNPAGVLTDEGYRALLDALPDVAQLEPVFGKRRKYGQKSHDRYALEWEPGLDLAPPWRDFVAELRGEAYRAFLRRVLGIEPRLRFHWHYTPPGCSVSPHCDSKHKIGSHIFYFNRAAEWDPGWGGETLVLDDGGRLHSDSHPGFGDFDSVVTAHSVDNYSLIFMRRGNSWHGVREITCPEGHMRRVFIVVFERPALARRVKSWFGLEAPVPD